MPDPVSQLLEQLEGLVGCTMPVERGKAFHELPKYAPAEPTGSRANSRRRNPRSGGVLIPRDPNASWAVNIRPKNWGDRDKIWWGKIKTKKDAQRISDIMHYYLGCKTVHFLFPGSDRPPPFQNANLSRLNTLEKRMQYVMRIAKGEEHQAHRRELTESVKEMVTLLMVVTQEDGSPAAAAAAEEVPWTCSISQPRLGGEDYRLSSEIPSFPEEEIEYMMAMLLDDAVY